MHADHWKTQIILGAGEELKYDGSRTSGFMEEEDITTYSIVASEGTKVGSVVVRDHTAVRGFRRTIRITQTNLNGQVLVETAYTVS